MGDKGLMTVIVPTLYCSLFLNHRLTHPAFTPFKVVYSHCLACAADFEHKAKWMISGGDNLELENEVE